MHSEKQKLQAEIRNVLAQLSKMFNNVFVLSHLDSTFKTRVKKINQWMLISGVSLMCIMYLILLFGSVIILIKELAIKILTEGY